VALRKKKPPAGKGISAGLRKPLGPDEGFSPDDEGLFTELKELRRRLASERRVPAYVVFSDATLLEMARTKPQSAAELLTISGVGTMKLDRYGEVFLAAIAGYAR
jgi:ATP-dependent DNA helicase RecQ